MLTKLAWRNIWRNKRRSILTIGSVAFAVFFSVFMQSIQKGAWDHMLNNVVNFYYGYAQVHKAGYWDNQSLDESLPLNADFIQELKDIDGIQDVAPRLESFALASVGERTKGVLVIGTEAEAENNLTKLADHIVAGQYWTKNSQKVLVAEGVAKQLEISVGDTIILLSQGYHGANAAGKYAIEGLLRFGSPELNKRMVYMPYSQATYFFGADQRATSLALKINSKDELPTVLTALNEQLDTSVYEIMRWESMMPELVEAKELDTAGNLLVLGVLYLIIIFGIFGTILMMLRERLYEFGVLLGIGMRRIQLGFTIWLEVVLLGFLGVLTGMAIAFPLVYYVKENPIDLSSMGEEAVEAYEKFGMEPVLPAIIDPEIFITQAIIVFFFTSFLGIYAFWKIRSLNPIQAMREG